MEKIRYSIYRKTNKGDFKIMVIEIKPIGNGFKEQQAQAERNMIKVFSDEKSKRFKVLSLDRNNTTIENYLKVGVLE